MALLLLLMLLLLLLLLLHGARDDVHAAAGSGCCGADGWGLLAAVDVGGLCLGVVASAALRIPPLLPALHVAVAAASDGSACP